MSEDGIFKIPKDEEYLPWQCKWCSIWDFKGSLVTVVSWDYKNELNFIRPVYDKFHWEFLLRAKKEDLKDYEGLIKLTVITQQPVSGIFFDSLTREKYVDLKPDLEYYSTTHICTIPEYRAITSKLISTGVKIFDTIISPYEQDNHTEKTDS